MIRTEAKIEFEPIDLVEELKLLPLKPDHDNIVCKELQTRQIGKLVVPDNSQEARAMVAVVLAIGPNVSEYSIGDHIYFGQYAGARCNINGREYLLQAEEDIIGKIVEPGFAYEEALDDGLFDGGSNGQRS